MMPQNETVVKGKMKFRYGVLLFFVLALTLAAPFFIVADFEKGVPVYLSATLILVTVFLGLKWKKGVSRETPEEDDEKGEASNE